MVDISEIIENNQEINKNPKTNVENIGFSPILSWSHYRALMRIDNEQERLFNEKEALECGWNKIQLQR